MARMKLHQFISDRITKSDEILAKERTEWIFAHPSFNKRTLTEILQAAYLQGIWDCAKSSRAALNTKDG